MEMEDYKKYEPIFGSWYLKKEIGRGSFGTVYEIRKESYGGAVNKSALKIISVDHNDEETLKNKFKSLYNAFNYGAPPHAGMAPGLDRMLMLLAEEENIREVIAFPMNSNAQDLLLGSPTEVTEQQLREAHIKIR